jgi:hypothetical protein
LFAPHPEIASTMAKPVTRIGEFDGLRCFLSWWKFFRQLGERKPAFWAHLPMLHGVVPNNILPNVVAALCSADLEHLAGVAIHSADFFPGVAIPVCRKSRDPTWPATGAHGAGLM